MEQRSWCLPHPMALSLCKKLIAERSQTEEHHQRRCCKLAEASLTQSVGTFVHGEATGYDRSTARF